VKANGLTIVGTTPNRMLLDVRGSVVIIEKALHVTMRLYHDPISNRLFHAPDHEPTINLSVPVLSISGLNNYYVTRPALNRNQYSKNNYDKVDGGSGPDSSYRGYDFRAAYAPGVSYTGSGQTVGLVQFDGFSPNDISTYEDSAGISSHVSLDTVLLGGFNGQPVDPYGADIEVCLDIEMAISMAPGLSKVMIYEAPPDSETDSTAWDDLLNRIATDNEAKQISCSWYIPGGPPNEAAEQIFEEMDVQGQSFFTASGDYGAYSGSIPFPNNSPNITIVGGTVLTTSGPDGPWQSETTWSGSGGGVDASYSIPIWQQDVNMSNNGGSTTKRNIPDVALTATNCYVYADGQGWYGLSGWVGTSFAAPLWAGFTALANEQAATDGEQPVGFINPAIYSLGVNSQLSSDFHDITTGNNNGFNAVTGYDLCTGWGTPKGQSTINDLTEAQLFALAYQNESLYSGATSDNHNRVLAQGNNLYETFMSKGEIFVRRSTDGGASWDVTTRVSSGNGSNSKPSIVVYPVVGTTDTVNVVWERNLCSGTYDIYYAMSGNSGASWTSPVIIANGISVSSNQYGGPQPVIAGIARGAAPPPPAPTLQPESPANYMHGILLVYTSSNGLYYKYKYFYGGGWNWNSPRHISTSASGSSVWYPSLASNGGTASTEATLSYDARYYQTVYSNYYDAPTDSWGTEQVVYSGSQNGSYDRQSCIAVNGYLYDAWNSYNSSTGYYTVKFRQGTEPNTWRNWTWTYAGTSANYYSPSICAYNGGTNVAITEYTSPGNQVLLHKADIYNQTWQTYTVGSDALVL